MLVGGRGWAGEHAGVCMHVARALHCAWAWRLCLPACLRAGPHLTQHTRTRNTDVLSPRATPRQHTRTRNTDVLSPRATPRALQDRALSDNLRDAVAKRMQQVRVWG